MSQPRANTAFLTLERTLRHSPTHMVHTAYITSVLAAFSAFFCTARKLGREQTNGWSSGRGEKREERKPILSPPPPPPAFLPSIFQSRFAQTFAQAESEHVENHARQSRKMTFSGTLIIYVVKSSKLIKFVFLFVQLPLDRDCLFPFYQDKARMYTN